MTISVSVGGGDLGFPGRVLGGWHCRSCEKVLKFQQRWLLGFGVFISSDSVAVVRRITSAGTAKVVVVVVRAVKPPRWTWRHRRHRQLCKWKGQTFVGLY